MPFAIRDSLLITIQDRKFFIERMLFDYPSYIRRCEIERKALFTKESAEIACDDAEIYDSTYNQFATLADCDEDLKNVFYQSMLLMVYSYYESILTKMSAGATPKTILRDICIPNNITLSASSMKDIIFISDEVSLIRNNICHNNAGTPRNSEKVRIITNKYNGILFEDGEIRLTDETFVSSILEKSYSVLLELAEGLGSKTRIV